MQSPGREPSMEDILASIKKVIAEEKDLRLSPVEAAQQPEDTPPEAADDDVLELAEPLAPQVDLVPPPLDLGPPLVDQEVAETSRHSLDVLSTVAAATAAVAAAAARTLKCFMPKGLAKLK